MGTAGKSAVVARGGDRQTTMADKRMSVRSGNVCFIDARKRQSGKGAPSRQRALLCHDRTATLGGLSTLPPR